MNISYEMYWKKKFLVFIFLVHQDYRGTKSPFLSNNLHKFEWLPVSLLLSLQRVLYFSSLFFWKNGICGNKFLPSREAHLSSGILIHCLSFSSFKSSFLLKYIIQIFDPHLLTSKCFPSAKKILLDHVFLGTHSQMHGIVILFSIMGLTWICLSEGLISVWDICEPYSLDIFPACWEDCHVFS